MKLPTWAVEPAGGALRRLPPGKGIVGVVTDPQDARLVALAPQALGALYLVAVGVALEIRLDHPLRDHLLYAAADGAALVARAVGEGGSEAVREYEGAGSPRPCDQSPPGA